MYNYQANVGSQTAYNNVNNIVEPSYNESYLQAYKLFGKLFMSLAKYLTK